MTDEEQAKHAGAFGEVFRQLTAAAIDFAKAGNSPLNVVDIAKAHLAAGTWLVASIADRATAVALLREFTDQVERGGDVEKHN